MSLFIGFLVMIMVSMAPLQYGGAAEFPEIVVTNDTKHVLVYTRGMVDFPQEIEEAILVGAKVTISYTMILYQQRDYWFDKKITESVVANTIKYDTVKKIFQVTLAGHKEPVIFSEIAAAKNAINELNNISVAPVSQLSKNNKYHLEMKAKLEKERHPMIMDIFAIFLSWRNFETEWFRHQLAR
ncbi:MAG: DUF4390 domain-containing protein [Smithellaceae bacterium]|nr:DUF4390 domain-containing protein [Smithellaceae bacterium]